MHIGYIDYQHAADSNFIDTRRMKVKLDLSKHLTWNVKADNLTPSLLMSLPAHRTKEDIIKTF